MTAAVAAMAGLLLSDCAGNDAGLSNLMVAPGKYEFYKCPQLIPALQQSEARARQLQRLMVKAGTGVGGRLVSATVYEPKYLSVRGDIDLLHKAIREQNCHTPMPAPVATPTRNGKAP